MTKTTLAVVPSAFTALAVLSALATGVVGAGCGGDSSGSGGSPQGSSSTTSSTSGGGHGGAGQGGSNPGGGGAGGGGLHHYCAKGCSVPADCCPMGQPNCPSGQYPGNYTCEHQICGAPQCHDKQDCASLGAKYDCLTINVLHACAEVCSTDADCTAPATCSGAAASMVKFCKAPTSSGGCKTDMECNGFGKCDNGACVCMTNADCTSPSADVCVP